jgi:2-methylisocitrate lyase-like PEP mutase family enzyme
LAEPSIIVAPGAHDALTARIIERAGFEAVYFTGAGFSYTHLATPDLGLVTATETISRLAAITEATALPVLADGDTGYGNWLNVQRTVRDFERAGAAAIQIEDQVFPKRCGHLAGKAIIPADEATGKIKAAADARRGDLVIIARTDARAVTGLDDALDRAARYREAGADVVFVEAPASRAELALIPGRVAAPALANMVEGGSTPPSTAAELEAMGYRIVIYPGAGVRAAAWAVARLMAELKAHGTTEGMRAEMLTFGELNELLGLDTFRRAEARYLPPP